MISIILLLVFITNIISGNIEDCYQCIKQNYETSDYKHKDCVKRFSKDNCGANTESMGSRCSGEVFKIDCIDDDNRKEIEELMEKYTLGHFGTKKEQSSYEVKLYEDDSNSLYNPSNFYCYWEREIEVGCNVKAAIKITNYPGVLKSDDKLIMEILYLDGKDTKNVDLNCKEITETITYKYPLQIDVYYYSREAKTSLPFVINVELIGVEECELNKKDEKIPVYAWVSLVIGIIIFFAIVIVCCCCCCKKAMYRRQIIIGADGLPAGGIQMGVNGDVNIYAFDPNVLDENEIALRKEELISAYKKHLYSNKVAIEKFQQKNCPICMENFKDVDKKELFFTDCGQFIHYKCIKKTIKEAKTLKCPFCNSELTVQVNNPNKTKKKAEYDDLQKDSASSRDVNQQTGNKEDNVMRMKENQSPVNQAPDDQTDDRTNN